VNLYDIGTNIKILRKEKKITQQELSLLAGISRVTLGKIEKGLMGTVSVKTLDIIISTLGYEIDFKVKNDFGLKNLDELQNE